MTVNIATAVYKATGSTTSRSLGTRAAEIINVKDYGAVGNGVHDDTTNIQAAFDAAFGPAGAPHGASGNLNTPVYFPAGIYLVSAPLYLTSVNGAWIFGAGSLSSTITFSGPFNGNTVASGGGANLITPIIMLNGYRNSRMEGLGFSIPDTPNGSVALYLFTQSSGVGGANTSTQNLFADLLIQNATTGILAGYQSTNGTCSECTYINVTFVNCPLAGLRTVSQNALNHSVYGGGAASCGTSGGSSAAYSCVTGAITPICDASLAGNKVDFYCASSGPTSIIGGRSEGGSGATCIIATGSQFHVSGFLFDPSPATGMTFVDVSSNGFAVLDGCSYQPATGGGTIIKLGSSGIVVADNLYSTSTADGITGTSGSKLYLRGCSFANSTPLSGFSGTVGQNI